MTRRHRSRGQSMVELAILLPVLMTLFLGSWTAADLVSDNNIAAQATRAGARLAAEIGDNSYATTSASGCQTSSTDPCQVDLDIINQVLPIVDTKLTNATVTLIYIYQPSACTNGGTFSYGGSFSSSTCPPNDGDFVAGELVDKYSISGSTATWTNPRAAKTYWLNLRSQVHPNEAELGVKLFFSYTSPTLKFFTQTDSQYTVVRLAPVE